VSELEISALLEMSREPGAGSHRALGRLMRLADDCDPLADEVDMRIKSGAFRAARIGLTGPPGAGKSSLIASALETIVGMGKRVGVLAVDPTSPFTGGALLGDRVRLKGPTPESVFFRSMASRGALGGVSRSIWPASRLLDWWGADVILIETVGSGQLGTGVGDVAELVVAVLTPEAGDGVQSMKAGVMELADCFVVNKSDRPGADLVFRELKNVREEARSVGRDVEVFLTSAMDSDGIDEAVEGIKSLWNRLNESGDVLKRRKEQVKREVAFRVETALKEIVAESLGGMSAYQKTLSGWVEKIISGETTAGLAASALAKIKA
jgi:LAO/AO transport system kinase